jgi:molybdenum cofactor synthesis domain-containing protein
MTIPLIKVGILTASDRSSRGERKDESGLLLKSLIEERLGAEVVAYRVVPDDKPVIQKVIVHMADLFFCDLILTTGGTGLGPRDVTPEATKELIEKEIPGISEAIRRQSMKKTKFAMLSRAVAGVRGKTLIINLPGSPNAVQEAFEVLEDVLVHAIELVHGEVQDCQKTLHLLSSHS